MMSVCAVGSAICIGCLNRLVQLGDGQSFKEFEDAMIGMEIIVH